MGLLRFGTFFINEEVAKCNFFSGLVHSSLPGSAALLACSWSYHWV
jgi:hypothetical protein